MTKKKKRKHSGAGAKKTMEVDLKWLEENPEATSGSAPAATSRRNTIDVDPSWLEDGPNVDIEMPRDSSAPKRIVPPALPPLEVVARSRMRVPAIPREEAESELPPPPARRTSRRPPAPSAAPPAAGRTSKRPPAPSEEPPAPRRTSKRPPPA